MYKYEKVNTNNKSEWRTSFILTIHKYWSYDVASKSACTFFFYYLT